MSRHLMTLLAAVAALGFGAPLSAQDHEGHDHGDGAVPHEVPEEAEKATEDRTLSGRIDRFAGRLAERLAELERPAAEIDGRVEMYERTFLASLDDPRMLRSVYQDRLRELRIRLEARGVRGDALEARLEAAKAHYDAWFARRNRPVRLPDPQG